MNEHHHYEILITRRTGQRVVVVRRRIGSLQAEVASGFTGVYFGLYASANGQMSENAAWFDGCEVV